MPFALLSRFTTISSCPSSVFICCQTTLKPNRYTLPGWTRDEPQRTPWICTTLETEVVSRLDHIAVSGSLVACHRTDGRLWWRGRCRCRLWLPARCPYENIRCPPSRDGSGNVARCKYPLGYWYPHENKVDLWTRCRVSGVLIPFCPLTLCVDFNTAPSKGVSGKV